MVSSLQDKLLSFGKPSLISDLGTTFDMLVANGIKSFTAGAWCIASCKGRAMEHGAMDEGVPSNNPKKARRGEFDGPELALRRKARSSRPKEGALMLSRASATTTCLFGLRAAQAAGPVRYYMGLMDSTCTECSFFSFSPLSFVTGIGCVQFW